MPEVVCTFGDDVNDVAEDETLAAGNNDVGEHANNTGKDVAAASTIFIIKEILYIF